MMLARTISSTVSVADIAQRLRDYGIPATRQRLRIATVLFENDGHLSAQALHHRVNQKQPRICRATVYNTLHLFVKRGLIREVAVNASKVFYDTNTRPHYHLFNIDTEELWDIDPGSVNIQGLPSLPAGTRQEEIALVIRVRNSAESVLSKTEKCDAVTS